MTDLQLAPNAFLDNLLYTADPHTPHNVLFRPDFIPSTDKFARQWVDIEQLGQTQWAFTEPTTVQFRIPPHADVLDFLWIAFWLPDIYSPVAPPSAASGSRWAPFEFRWIEFLGCAVLLETELRIGGQCAGGFVDGLALYHELLARCANDAQVAALHESIGHVPELHDPANAPGRAGCYPNALPDTADPEPSIRARRVLVPLPLIFEGGYPLCRAREAELLLSVTFRPLAHWFRVRDTEDAAFDFPLVAPDFAQDRFRLFRFLNPPPDWSLAAAAYGAPDSLARNSWKADLRLLAEMVHLADDARAALCGPDAPMYLVTQIQRTVLDGVAGPARLSLPTANAYVCAFFVCALRSDVAARNEWFNLSNWAYRDHRPAPLFDCDDLRLAGPGGATLSPAIDPLSGARTGLLRTGARDDALLAKHILTHLGHAVGGSAREPLRLREEHELATRLRRQHRALDGLYAYSYGTHLDRPASGAMAWAQADDALLLATTITPPLDPDALQRLAHSRCAADVANPSPFLYSFSLRVYTKRLNLFLFPHPHQPGHLALA